MPPQRYFVDEAGDGVLFGPKGRNRLDDPDAMRFFMLGKVSIADETVVADALAGLRERLLANPLYASIPSFQTDAEKTAVFFHAKDDHPEIRSKVFETLVGLDFKFFAVIKDMRSVLAYVRQREKRQGHLPVPSQRTLRPLSAAALSETIPPAHLLRGRLRAAWEIGSHRVASRSLEGGGRAITPCRKHWGLAADRRRGRRSPQGALSASYRLLPAGAATLL